LYGNIALATTARQANSKMTEKSAPKTATARAAHQANWLPRMKQAPAEPQWQEPQANKHKPVITSTCKAPMARAACTNKFKHLQSPDSKRACTTPAKP